MCCLLLEKLKSRQVTHFSIVIHFYHYHYYQLYYYSMQSQLNNIHVFLAVFLYYDFNHFMHFVHDKIKLY